MSAREATPAVFENVLRRLGAYIDRRQAPQWVLGPGYRLAARDEVCSGEYNTGGRNTRMEDAPGRGRPTATLTTCVIEPAMVSDNQTAWQAPSRRVQERENEDRRTSENAMVEVPPGAYE